MDCNCPNPTELSEIGNVDCGVDLNQVQRIAVQRGGAYEFDESASPTPQDVKVLSVWQALKTATDDTKIVFTPMIGGDPIIEPGEAITVGGGDNSTLNGVEEVQGVNPSKFSCVFKSLPATIEKQMKSLMCEKNLVVYLFLQGGKVAVINAGTGVYKGFTAQSLFVSDRGNQGFGTQDAVNFSFSFPAGWSDDLEIVKLNFNPFTDI